jgi:hypothetical protein
MSGNTSGNTSTILNKIGNYAKTNFVVNWASATVLFGAITYSVVMYYQNDNLKETINSQKETVKTLKETVSTLQTTVATMSTTVEAFKANPPSVYDEKINGIYRMIDIYHRGNNGSTNHNPPSFTSTQPSSGVPNTTPNGNVDNP